MIHLRSKTKNLLDNLYMVVNTCDDHNALIASMQHIKSALAVIGAISAHPIKQVLPRKRIIAPNTNVRKQRNFLKQNKRKIIQLPKPSYYEQKKSKQSLSEINVKFCAVCFSEDDESISSDIVEWVQCGRCSMWIHRLCAHIDIKNDKHYICNYCV